MPNAHRLPDAERRRHEEVLRHFEEAWRGGRSPILEEYLPADPAERAALLVELVHLDLEYRIKRGEPVTLVSYTQRYPELSRHPNALADMRAAAEAMRRRAGFSQPAGPAAREPNAPPADELPVAEPPPAPESAETKPPPADSPLPDLLATWREEAVRPLRRKLRRYRALVATLGALLLTAGVFLWLLMAGYEQMRRERDAAREQLQRAHPEVAPPPP
jgi:hypothetical protein